MFILTCGNSKICLPSLYIPVQLFVSITSRNRIISSSKFALNRIISMEVRFNTFSLSELRETRQRRIDMDLLRTEQVPI
jgi:hypothetical protein